MAGVRMLFADISFGGHFPTVLQKNKTTFQRHLMQSAVPFDFPEIKPATIHDIAADRRGRGTRVVRRYFLEPCLIFSEKYKYNYGFE